VRPTDQHGASAEPQETAHERVEACLGEVLGDLLGTRVKVRPASVVR
jgi:hypothetical protein